MKLANLLSNALRWAARWYSVPIALAFWEILARSGLVNPLLTPTLEMIWRALEHGFADGTLIYQADWTMARAGLGFAMAVFVGVLLGSGMALSGRFEAVFEPLFVFGYPIPKISLYPIFAFLFGLSSGPKVALVFLECLYPIAMQTYQGVKMVNERDLWVARAMGASRVQIYFRVILPRAAPYIMSSLRIAAHIAIATVVILEMIGDSTGLGYYINYEAASFEFATSFAAVAVVLLLGFVVDRALMFLRQVVVFWENNEVQTI